MSGAENFRVLGRGFVIRWRTKNFSMFGKKEISSEHFVVPILGNTKWYLKFLSEGPKESNIKCFLCRGDDGPEYIKALYAIFVLSSYVVELQTFAKNSTCLFPGLINHAKFIDLVNCDLSRDDLHVECHLWPDNDAEVPILVGPYPVGIEMVAKVAKEARGLFYKIPNFSNLSDGKAIEFSVPSAYDFGRKLVCRLWIDQQKLNVLVRESERSQEFLMLKCQIYLLDVFRDRHLLYHGRTVINNGEDPAPKAMIFSLAMSKKQLMEKKDLYLPGDELLLHCEFTTSFNQGIITIVERSLYEDPPGLQVNHDLKWGVYLERKYNEHRWFFRLLALLVVVLSVLPHLLFENTP